LSARLAVKLRHSGVPASRYPAMAGLLGPGIDHRHER
jgi:hypothetical protein